MKFDMISAERFKTHFMYTAFYKNKNIYNFKNINKHASTTNNHHTWAPNRCYQVINQNEKLTLHYYVLNNGNEFKNVGITLFLKNIIKYKIQKTISLSATENWFHFRPEKYNNKSSFYCNYFHFFANISVHI